MARPSPHARHHRQHRFARVVVGSTVRRTSRSPPHSSAISSDSTPWRRPHFPVIPRTPRRRLDVEADPVDLAERRPSRPGYAPAVCSPTPKPSALRLPASLADERTLARRLATAEHHAVELALGDAEVSSTVDQATITRRTRVLHGRVVAVRALPRAALRNTVATSLSGQSTVENGSKPAICRVVGVQRRGGREPQIGGGHTFRPRAARVPTRGYTAEIAASATSRKCNALRVLALLADVEATAQGGGSPSRGSRPRTRCVSSAAHSGHVGCSPSR